MQNTKYSKAKIYKIVDVGYNKCYYGSTITTLNKRFYHHKRDYKQSKKSSNSYQIFDEYGLDNVKIELVELVNVNNKEELLKIEGGYIKNNDCVNKNIAGRTKQEYRFDKRDNIKTYNKQYRDKIKQLKFQSTNQCV